MCMHKDERRNKQTQTNKINNCKHTDKQTDQQTKNKWIQTNKKQNCKHTNVNKQTN